MEKKKKSTGLKTKFWIGLAAVFMAGTFGGCTLAIPEAGLDGGGDRLIGAFITSEYLDLYDMEGYLNDHASKLSEGETITVGKDSKYEGNCWQLWISPRGIPVQSGKSPLEIFRDSIF